MKEISNNRIPFFQSFLCPIDWKLNRELKGCLKYGIRKVLHQGQLFTEILFRDFQTKYEFWDCERWEGWLKFGTFRNMWGQLCYEYENKRPTRRTMNRFLKELKKYYKEKAKETGLK